MKFGSKKAIFGGDLWGGLRGLDLVWKSDTPPTHIWENFPKFNLFFWGGGFPKPNVSVTQQETAFFDKNKTGELVNR